MLRLTRDDIMHIAPRPKKQSAAAIWDSYVAALTSREASELFEKYQINTPLRINHALATMVAETNLSLIWESGAYTVSGILKTFGVGNHSARITPAEAAKIAALPVNADGSGPRCEALFERVYGQGNPKKAKELGNKHPGDGYNFRGMGLVQCTGRWAWENAAKKIGVSLDSLPLPINCVHSLLVEWNEKNCNKYADNDDPVSIRKLINGGSLKVPTSRINGLPNAVAALARAKAVITLADFEGYSVDGDVPSIATAIANPNKPMALMQSTEMQAGVMGSGATGVGASNQWMDILPRAFGAATATGRFSVTAFLFALLSDPVFWIAASLTMATFGGIYLTIKRWKRFHIFGV
mgnify:CR=1 FL=1